jgi:hypothetical protein
MGEIEVQDSKRPHKEVGRENFRSKIPTGKLKRPTREFNMSMMAR